MLTNRPLNAISGGRLFRLAEVEVAPPAPPADEAIAQAIDVLQQAEDALRLTVLPALGWAQDKQKQLMEFLAATPNLAEHWREFQDREHWREAQEQHFLPRIGAGLRYVFEAMGDSPAARKNVEGHLATVRQVFDVVGARYDHEAARQAQGIMARAAAADPDWAQAPRLSQMALRASSPPPGFPAFWWSCAARRMCAMYCKNWRGRWSRDPGGNPGAGWRRPER